MKSLKKIIDENIKNEFQLLEFVGENNDLFWEDESSMQYEETSFSQTIFLFQNKAIWERKVEIDVSNDTLIKIEKDWIILSHTIKG